MAALRTAMRLTEYDDILDARQSYSVLALAALASRSYGICSKVEIKVTIKLDCGCGKTNIINTQPPSSQNFPSDLSFLLYLFSNRHLSSWNLLAL